MLDEADSPLLPAADSSLRDKVVLVAIDGSEHAFYAFQWYLLNIHQPSNRVIILHCPEMKSIMKVPVRSPDSDSVRSMMEEQELQNAKLVDRIKDNLQASQVNARFIKQSGNPGHVIVEVADENRATLIVAGTRGHSRVRRTLIGSVSDYVLHHAHCPVLICRMKDK